MAHRSDNLYYSTCFEWENLMLEAYGNIWDLLPNYGAIVITTNGYVKKNGEAVMGRGIAKEAVDRFPEFPKRLGYALQKCGNKTFRFPNIVDYIVFTLPVKPQYGPNGEMGWKAKADINLIQESVVDLVRLASKDLKIIMPRPGCGNGKLFWKDVKPVIEPLLDDRFTVVTFDA